MDEIIYIPTGKSPVNRKFEASSLDRITMLKNATKRYDFITVSDFEVTSENISYSVDTVRHYKSEYNNCLMRLIIRTLVEILLLFKFILKLFHRQN